MVGGFEKEMVSPVRTLEGDKVGVVCVVRKPSVLDGKLGVERMEEGVVLVVETSLDSNVKPNIFLGPICW